MLPRPCPCLLLLAFPSYVQAADIMAGFFERCAREPAYWDKISKAGLERIYSRWGKGGRGGW